MSAAGSGLDGYREGAWDNHQGTDRRAAYKARDGKVYNLNLIDTPGHVDFSYEVSRSLSACEGALLVVDASQGVEAQTVANCYTALDLGVEVLPVLNKMDLPNADPDNAKAEIEDVIGIDAIDAIPCSAKTGMGIEEILEAIVARVPQPRGNPEAPLRAMIIDSWFDTYVGVVMLVRVVDGRLAKRRAHQDDGHRRGLQRRQPGCVHAGNQPRDALEAGEVGYIIAGIRELQAAKVGDTVTLEKKLPNNLGTGQRSHCRASRRSSLRCLPVCIRPKPANTKVLARQPWRNSSSTTASLHYEPEVSRRRSDSASAAASLACCTWRSFRSGSNASSTRT
jgi:GTP-binding protein LepA